MGCKRRIGLVKIKRDWRGVAVKSLPVVAFVLLLSSLFLPWWTISTDARNRSYYPDLYFDGDYGPASTPFELSPLGVGINIHFWILLVFLSVSIVLFPLGMLVGRRAPRLSLFLRWGAAIFCLAGIVTFSLTFPRIGYAGDTGQHINWISGSAECYCPGGGHQMSWHASTGLLVAVASVIMMIVLNVRLCFGQPRKTSLSSEARGISPSKKWYNGSITRLLVFPVVWVMIASVAWTALSQPPTISTKAFTNELGWEYWFEWKSFEDGDMAYVTGTVTKTYLIPTSYGPLTYVGLDEDEVPFFLDGDLRSQYVVGSRVAIPVHFQSYYFDDQYYHRAYPGVDKISVQFESYAASLEYEGFSLSTGVLLMPEKAGPTSAQYRVYTGYGLPLGVFNISLLSSGYPYSWVGDPEFRWRTDFIDQMEPLRDGMSSGGKLKFTDVNGNGLLDWNDSIEVSLSPTVDSHHIEAYVLRLMGPNDGFAFITVRERGPFVFMNQQLEDPSSFFWFDMPPDIVAGNACSSSVEITRGLLHAKNASDFTIKITRPDSPLTADLPANSMHQGLPWDGTVSYVDGGEIGVLDIGDSWALENVTTGASYVFSLEDGDSGPLAGRLGWTCGLGPRIAYRPRVTLSPPTPDPGDTERLFINVTAVDWTPGVKLQSFGTLLLKNSSVLLPLNGRSISLGSLPVGPSIDGVQTWLCFNDRDGDGYLSAGDRFEVNRTAPQSTYQLFLYYDRILTNVSWTT